MFGRPDGVTGSFDSTPTSSNSNPQPTVAAPDPVLAEAFGRPDAAADSLQRDPDARFGEVEEQPMPADPWRDPDSAAALSAPAVATASTPQVTGPGPKLSPRDLLTGRGLAWHTLLTLGLIVAGIALIGGLVGRLTAEVVAPLNSDTVHLATGSDGDGAKASSTVSKVAKAVERAVVSIDVRSGSSGGTGSGFVVDKQGYIVTNNHVISMAANDPGNSRVEVVFFDRTRVPARIVGRDPKNDVAVIKVDKVDNLTVAQIGDSTNLQIGQEVIAFGSPLGLDKTVTTGIVSAVHRPVPLRPDDSSDTDAVIDAIQTDAAINPGNSGGPLVDDSGRVIGVNTAIRSAAGGSIGLGFAIPVDQVMPIAQTLIRNGQVKHAQIGLNTRDVRNTKVLGAEIVNVVTGGPADAAGLREGDVVTGYNGKSVEGADELTVMVRTSKVGAAVPFTYWRGGRTFNGTITPGSD